MFEGDNKYCDKIGINPWFRKDGIMDWQTVLFDPEKGLIQYFDKIALKYFPHDHGEAEQAVNDAIKAITADNYARLNKSKDVANPRAYMTTVVTNLIRDASISKYGKCRPPEWVKRLGTTWTQVHKLLCCFQQDASQVCFDLMSAEISESRLATICKEIKTKHVKCGSELAKPQFQSMQQESEHGSNLDDKVSSTSLEADISQQEFSVFLDSLSHLLFGKPVGQNTPILASMQQLQQRISLEPQQILILKLIFQEGKSVSEAANLLNIKRHVVDYQMKKIMTHLKEAFELCGINL